MQAALRHQLRRARRQAKSRLTHKSRLLHWKHTKALARKLSTKASEKQRVYDYIIKAPKNFSFVESPSEIIDFIERLHTVCYPQRRILINLQHITRMTQCASLILASRIQSGDSFTRGAELIIREPSDPACLRTWRSSSPTPLKPGDTLPLYQNRILGRRRHHKQVEVKLAEFLVHEAMRYLSGGKTMDQHGAYRTLTECMSNTFKHADPKTEATENWWVASYVHEESEVKRWCFAFVDNGVGILESLRIKGFFLTLKKILGLLPNHRTLQMMMEGKIGSRLGLNYRGKGLPGIYTELKRGRIENLVIVANDVQANFAKEEYVTLTKPFLGTFLYWELTLPSQL